MACWLDDRVCEVRSQLCSSDEGAVWTLFFEDPYGEPIIACAINDATAQMDGTLLRNLANMIDEGPWRASLIAIIRSCGTPRDEDYQLWKGLRAEIQTTTLLDLLIVGECTYWSAEGNSSGA